MYIVYSVDKNLNADVIVKFTNIFIEINEPSGLMCCPPGLEKTFLVTVQMQICIVVHVTALFDS